MCGGRRVAAWRAPGPTVDEFGQCARIWSGNVAVARGSKTLRRHQRWPWEPRPVQRRYRRRTCATGPPVSRRWRRRTDQDRYCSTVAHHRCRLLYLAAAFGGSCISAFKRWPGTSDESPCRVSGNERAAAPRWSPRRMAMSAAPSTVIIVLYVLGRQATSGRRSCRLLRAAPAHSLVLRPTAYALAQETRRCSSRFLTRCDSRMHGSSAANRRCRMHWMAMIRNSNQTAATARHTEEEKFASRGN